MVISDWGKSGRLYRHHINIPVNTSAIIHIPGNDPDKVYENGVIASASEGIHYLRIENNFVVFEVGSGCYNFYSEIP
jgi:alpha-L-rhamnosidase